MRLRLRQFNGLRASLFGLVSCLVFTSFAGDAAAHGRSKEHRKPFVERRGADLYLGHDQFRFAGTNNYYPVFKSMFMVDDVLEAAARNGFTVFRTWAALDIGYADGTNSVDGGPKDGVYYHYFDAETHAPAFNEGESGLERLDYVLFKAQQLGIRMVLSLVNNWREFGGMAQYIRWLETETADPAHVFYHADFYTDPTIRRWYQEWVAHLLERTNIYTGVQYKDDPTIMTWELANEPRCAGSSVAQGGYRRGPDCSTTTLISWADEMSQFVKSIDPNHLVSMGDEGFYCEVGATSWTEDCSQGVDSKAFTALEAIDVMSLHLYPQSWGQTTDWGTDWITRHFADARVLGKVAMLGEYGYSDRNARSPVYRAWTDAVRESGGAGALFWLLSGLQDDGTLYPDYDGFTVYDGDPVCTLLSNFATSLSDEDRHYFTPIADHDLASGHSGRLIEIFPLANDQVYGRRNTLALDSIDLDPETRGRQDTRLLESGLFEALPDGRVVFTPAVDFLGDASLTYTVKDSRGERSNVAAITVTVRPLPPANVTLFSFETGTDGFAAADFDSEAGTVAQTTLFVSEGSYGLSVDTSVGGWFSVPFPSPVDLSAYTTLSMDLLTPPDATGIKFALRVGPSENWCEGPDQVLTPDAAVTSELDLQALSCVSSLGEVSELLVYIGTDVGLDNVRAFY